MLKRSLSFITALIVYATAIAQMTAHEADEITGTASFTFSDVTEEIISPTFKVGPVTLTTGYTDKASSSQRPKVIPIPRFDLCSENSITFTLDDDSYYIQEIDLVKFDGIVTNNFSELVCESGLLDDTLYQAWFCQNDRPSSVTISKPTVPDSKNNRIYFSQFVVVYRKKEVQAPSPRCESHDKENNLLYLSVIENGKDITNQSEIRFGVSSGSTILPICTSVYTGSIDLASLALDDNMTYIWAQAITDGHDFSDISLVFSYKYNQYSTTEGITYKAVTDDHLTDNHWYIITAKPTKTSSTYVMAEKTTQDGLYNSAPFRLPDDDILGVTIHDFEKAKVLEFQYINGQLIEKNTGKPLQSDNTQSHITGDPTAVDFSNTEGQHLLTIGGQQIGFKDFNFVFGATEPIPVKLYTTGTDMNTGESAALEDSNDSPVHYYNLQGIEVTDPAHGLYIKRQGNKINKIIIP